MWCGIEIDNVTTLDNICSMECRIQFRNAKNKDKEKRIKSIQSD